MLAKTTTLIAALTLVRSAAAVFDCIYPKGSTPRPPVGACCDSLVNHNIPDIPFESTGKECTMANMHSTDPCGRDLYFDCKWNQKAACCEPLMMIPQAKTNAACNVLVVRPEHQGPPVPCPDPDA